MRTFMALVLMMTLTAEAYAQRMPGGQRRQNSSEQKADRQAPKVDDAAYKAALGRLPDKKFDPWQNVRGNPPAGNGQNPR